MDFVNYVKDGEQLRESLLSNGIVLTSLQNYYSPEKRTTEVRVAIAVEKDYLRRFLDRLGEVFVGRSKL